MAHTIRDRTKLLNRVRRVRGQLNGIEKLLENEEECGRVLQQLAACRGALTGLMAEILEGHVRHHVAGPDVKAGSPRADAVEELVDVLRSYFR
jgi:FrmR/RcnR family transcriptional regulator, repressor of frmRAB operon